MSTRAKFTLGTAILFSSFTVWFVHANQKAERDAMYKGVLRDEARQAAKRAAREEELQQSLLKSQRYSAVQEVVSSDSSR
ncbi:uncharacterized protein EI90DRAFT_3126176 [Cantharellus anzutake]|uniref:uncharacterized protein n=1 Tax=Cantharellus anzutake TaxID=1750568 RepID=UPI001902ED96|nr:uncharacterized protein EI90DRAFT_3126176 [Cantharellus anzutake]KAF8328390.1 hypothetical protein EI90DRAFT_3126176 [Cantharellus anzutake]